MNTESRLPDGWSVPAYITDLIDADGVELRRAGVSIVAPSGEEITGSAAEVGACPSQRSYFELLERVATLEAIRSAGNTCATWSSDGVRFEDLPAADVFPESDDGSQWRHARSNGVALHVDWKSACERARWELLERDRVLRSWYGEIRPEAIPFDDASPLVRAKSYEWTAYTFPCPDGSTPWSSGVEVVGVFGFPVVREAPLVFGYAAREKTVSALEAAAREAAQVLAFLWGEAIPDDAPAMGPTAMHHLERMLWRPQHGTLREWLAGGHAALAKRRARTVPHREEVRFVDLTPAWLTGGLRVAKAVHDGAEPLVFGASPFAAHLPPELRAHPIA